MAAVVVPGETVGATLAFGPVQYDVGAFDTDVFISNGGYEPVVEHGDAFCMSCISASASRNASVDSLPGSGYPSTCSASRQPPYWENKPPTRVVPARNQSKARWACSYHEESEGRVRRDRPNHRLRLDGCWSKVARGRRVDRIRCCQSDGSGHATGQLGDSAPQAVALLAEVKPPRTTSVRLAATDSIDARPARHFRPTAREAQAMVSACLAAYRATRTPRV